MKKCVALVVLFRLLLAFAIGNLTVANASMQIELPTLKVVTSAVHHQHDMAHCQEPKNDCVKPKSEPTHQVGCTDCQTLHCQSMNCTLIDPHVVSTLTISDDHLILVQEMAELSILTGYWQQILRPPKT